MRLITAILFAMIAIAILVVPPAAHAKHHKSKHHSAHHKTHHHSHHHQQAI